MSLQTETPEAPGGPFQTSGWHQGSHAKVVRIDKIYTGGGDTGTTSLGDGQRISKASPRIAAIGDIDETNAAIGLVRCRIEAEAENEILARVQNDLFDLGADIARPLSGKADNALRMSAEQGARLEQEIDQVNSRLEPLRSFVLRGGNRRAAALHFACTVCRRAERSVTALSDHDEINPHALVYLNRLSDLLFVMARDANDSGQSDVLWEPGQNARSA